MRPRVYEGPSNSTFEVAFDDLLSPNDTVGVDRISELKTSTPYLLSLCRFGVRVPEEAKVLVVHTPPQLASLRSRNFERLC